MDIGFSRALASALIRGLLRDSGLLLGLHQGWRAWLGFSGIWSHATDPSVVLPLDPSPQDGRFNLKLYSARISTLISRWLLLISLWFASLTIFQTLSYRSQTWFASLTIFQTLSYRSQTSTSRPSTLSQVLKLCLSLKLTLSPLTPHWFLSLAN